MHESTLTAQTRYCIFMRAMDLLLLLLILPSKNIFVFIVLSYCLNLENHYLFYQIFFHIFGYFIHLLNLDFQYHYL
jgi:hypothetical protein